MPARTVVLSRITKFDVKINETVQFGALPGLAMDLGIRGGNGCLQAGEDLIAQIDPGFTLGPHALKVGV